MKFLINPREFIRLLSCHCDCNCIMNFSKEKKFSLYGINTKKVSCTNNCNMLMSETMISLIY